MLNTASKPFLLLLLHFIGVLSTVGWSGRDDLTGSLPGRSARSAGTMSPKGLYTGPYFSPSLKSNYSAMVGDTVHLSCRVYQVDKQSISWVRSKDSHILSVGDLVFVSDPRILIVQNNHRGDWTLIVRDVRKSDEGAYECQISTQNKMSHLAYLKVLEPRVEIEGGPDIFTQKGSTVQVKCLISGSSHVNSVVWWHGTDRISTSENIEITLYREKDTTVSELIIKNVHSERIGNYSCHPHGLQPILIHLHVLNAMEQEVRTNTGSPITPGIILVGMLCLLA